MNNRSNWARMDGISNHGRETERPCPHCKGRWPDMDACVVCQGDGTVVLE
ncbi:hypothetical protein [Streptomyces sp. NPDC091027]